MASFAFSQGRSRKESAKVVKRGTVAAIKRTAVEDVQLREFDIAFDTFSRDRITDQTVLARLRSYRDRIPFTVKRNSQQYFAAALVLWYRLGEPSGEEIVEPENAAKYHNIADPILADLQELLVKRKKQVAKTEEEGEEGEEDVSASSARAIKQARPSLTLFRYVMMLIAALEAE